MNRGHLTGRRNYRARFFWCSRPDTNGYTAAAAAAVLPALLCMSAWTLCVLCLHPVQRCEKAASINILREEGMSLWPHQASAQPTGLDSTHGRTLAHIYHCSQYLGADQGQPCLVDDTHKSTTCLHCLQPPSTFLSHHTARYQRHYNRKADTSTYCCSRSE